MIKAAIVIPCYNEYKRLSIIEYENFISTTDDFLFIFVNDGSTDNTYEKLRLMQEKFPSRVTILNLTHNVGKGEAVRCGILSAIPLNTMMIGYIDADLSTPLKEISLFLKYFENSNYEMVFGSRILRIGANVHRFFLRHYLGRMMATVVSIYLKIPIYDSQCGAKFFSKRFSQLLFNKPFVSRWMFDIEIFKRISLNNIKIENCCYELPLSTWIEKGESKIRAIDVLKLPIELLRIAKYYSKEKHRKY